MGQGSSRVLSSIRLQEKQYDKVISEGEQNGFVNQVRNASPPYSRRVTANPASTPSSNLGLFKGLAHNLQSDIFDLMDVSWSNDERALEDRNAHEGLRWRSNETSDDEEKSPDETMEVGATPVRGRWRRFVRR
ncbi:hypothetical protein V6N12_002755 [Hibiscus sabdariffa]|uniref:Uncharacterized protein n=1 Tax=Hibiscus sabdariffa TaxID=183260 RepID=A0ABR2EAC7_9ROSI